MFKSVPLKVGICAAALVTLAAAPARSDEVTTTGGVSVKSEDGKYSFQLGGRVHFDAYVFDEDEVPVTSTTEFRRTRLTLSGSVLGWDYKVEQDFAAGSTTAGFRDVYIAKKAAGGTFTIGQFKPYRSMEELTSSNEITMMERPFSSASGLYGGRQFQQGLGYKTSGDQFSFGVAAFNLRHADSPRNEGIGAAARFTYAPVLTDTSSFHIGLSVSTEDSDSDTTPGASASVAYAGRRGPSVTIASRPAATGDSIDTVGFELAGTVGPFYAQAEYATASFGQGSGVPSQDVDTYYVMASWMLTGESKPYNSGSGVYRSARPRHESGAWELTARYDFIENKDVVDLEATAIAVGVNYYANRHVRFMLNYTIGDRKSPALDEDEVPFSFSDKTNQVALRTQLSF